MTSKFAEYFDIEQVGGIGQEFELSKPVRELALFTARLDNSVQPAQAKIRCSNVQRYIICLPWAS